MSFHTDRGHQQEEREATRKRQGSCEQQAVAFTFSDAGQLARPGHSQGPRSRVPRSCFWD